MQDEYPEISQYTMIAIDQSVMALAYFMSPGHKKKRMIDASEASLDLVRMDG